MSDRETVFVADAAPKTSVPDAVSFDGIDARAMYAARMMLASVVTRTVEAAPRRPHSRDAAAFEPHGVECGPPRVLVSVATT